MRIHVPKAEFHGAKGGEQKFGTKAASSELRGNEIQDLSDAVSDLTQAAAGHDLRYFVRIELGGEKAPPDNVVDSINEVLAKKVSKSLKLE